MVVNFGKLLPFRYGSRVLVGVSSGVWMLLLLLVQLGWMGSVLGAVLQLLQGAGPEDRRSMRMYGSFVASSSSFALTHGSDARRT